MSGWFTRAREELRQRGHHRAFRIPPPVWGPTQETYLDQLLVEVGTATEAAAGQPPYDERALATAATSLWRAQRKLAQPAQAGAAEARQAGRYLSRCGDALGDVGLVVRGHDGEAFHPGRSLEVLGYRNDPSSEGETVLETVRPSVYFNDQRIQMGQVIVGSPHHKPDNPGGSDG